jgi:type I restriction enzyme S subunit
LNQKCIRDHAINFGLGRRHDEAAKPVSSERFVQRGDVLVNSTGTGTLGRVAQVRSDPPEPTTVDTHVTIVRPRPGEFYTDFFGYALVLLEEQLAASGEGTSGQTELARSTISRFEIKYPTSLEEQCRIVAVLDEAFAAIATATANVEKNLTSARELFDAEISTVFGEAETDCERLTLAENSIEFGRGKSKHRPRNDPSLYGGSYPFIQTGDVRNCDHLITEYSQTYNEAGLAQSKLWPRGTICITIAANIAETGILDFDACFPDSVIGMVVDPTKTSRHYVEYLLQSFKSTLQAKGKGSAQANINLATFENERFPFPPLRKQQEMSDRLDAVAEVVRSLGEIYERKLSELNSLRQSLLHRAFSGEPIGAELLAA